MASPLLREAAASAAHPARSVQSCASNLLGFAISSPLNPRVSWGALEQS